MTGASSVWSRVQNGAGRAIAALLAMVGAARAADPAPMQFLVPAYFYPAASGSDWERLTAAAAAGAPITAIVNPASGPGDAVDPNYVRAIANLRRAGGHVLGYVPSGYLGRRVSPTSSCKPSVGTMYSVGDIVACAARYKAFYVVDGVFVDEMGPPAAGVPLDTVTAFYQALYDGLKRMDPAWRIVGNPGTLAPEALLRQGNSGGADMLVTFEERASAYPSAAPADYADRHPRSRFGAILIETNMPGAGVPFDFAATVALAATRHIGWLYATDGQLPNPYDRLPVGWDQQVQTLLTFNRGRHAR